MTDKVQIPYQFQIQPSGQTNAQPAGANRVWYDPFSDPATLANYTLSNNPVVNGGVLLPTPGQDCRVTLLSNIVAGAKMGAVQAKFTPASTQVDVWVSIGGTGARLQVTNSGAVNLFNASNQQLALGNIAPQAGVPFWLRLLMFENAIQGDYFTTDPTGQSIAVAGTLHNAEATTFPTIAIQPQIRLNAFTDGVPAGGFSADDFYVWSLDATTFS